MSKILGIVYRAISTHLIHRAGYQIKDGATGAVTLIQRFGSALLNIHFHVLFLDGVYVSRDNLPLKLLESLYQSRSTVLNNIFNRVINITGGDDCHPEGQQHQ